MDQVSDDAQLVRVQREDFSVDAEINRVRGSFEAHRRHFDISWDGARSLQRARGRQHYLRALRRDGANEAARNPRAGVEGF